MPVNTNVSFDLSALYAAMPQLPVAPKTDWPSIAFQAFKDVFTPSSMLTYGVTGATIGYFTGQSTSLAFIGASLGGAKDAIPVLYDQLPESVKEIAKETTKIGLFTLGTYGIYHMLPQGLGGLSKFLPDVPAALKTATDSWAATGATPRSLEAFLKPVLLSTLQLTNNFVIPSLKTTVTVAGFGDHARFAVAAGASYLSLKALEKIGEHPRVKPLSDVLKGLVNNGTKSVDKLINLSLAVSAIPLSQYVKATPLIIGCATKPLLYRVQDLASTLVNNGTYVAEDVRALFDTATTTLLDTLTSLDTYSTLGVGALLVGLHGYINHHRPAPSEKERVEEEEHYFQEIFDEFTALKDLIRSGGKVFSSHLEKFEAKTLKPLKDKLLLAQAVKIPLQITAAQNSVIAAIDAEVTRLERAYTSAPSSASKATALTLMLDVLDLKIREGDKQLTFVRQQQGNTAAQREAKRQIIYAALEAKQAKYQLLAEEVQKEIDAANEIRLEAQIESLIDIENEVRDNKIVPLTDLKTNVDRHIDEVETLLRNFDRVFRKS